MLTVKTGARGLEKPPEYAVNGFEVEFDELHGDTAPGGTLSVVGYPESHPHTLVLCGPAEGAWDIETAEVTYHYEDETPYTVRLGAVSLDAESNLNLLHNRPLPVVQV